MLTCAAFGYGTRHRVLNSNVILWHLGQRVTSPSCGRGATRRSCADDFDFLAESRGMRERTLRPGGWRSIAKSGPNHRYEFSGAYRLPQDAGDIQV